MLLVPLLYIKLQEALACGLDFVSPTENNNRIYKCYSGEMTVFLFCSPSSAGWHCRRLSFNRIISSDASNAKSARAAGGTYTADFTTAAFLRVYVLFPLHSVDFYLKFLQF